MDKRMALLLCGTAALIAANPVGQAAPVEPPSAVPAAKSYADLLTPIPNAVERLRIDDAVRSQGPRARLQLVEHHHHHNSFPGAIIGGIIGGALAGAASPYYEPYYERCYWTWGRPYWNGYRWVRPRVRVCN